MAVGVLGEGVAAAGHLLLGPPVGLVPRSLAQLLLGLVQLLLQVPGLPAPALASTSVHAPHLQACVGMWPARPCEPEHTICLCIQDMPRPQGLPYGLPGLQLCRGRIKLRHLAAGQHAAVGAWGLPTPGVVSASLVTLNPEAKVRARTAPSGRIWSAAHPCPPAGCASGPGPPGTCAWPASTHRRSLDS